jgi:hypothetical protein
MNSKRDEQPFDLAENEDAFPLSEIFLDDGPEDDEGGYGEGGYSEDDWDEDEFDCD